MNTDKILRLADFIEASETYNQATYFNICGTPACIAGHAVALFIGIGNYPFNMWGTAMHLLGFDSHTAAKVFNPRDPEPTAKEAAEMLRFLVEYKTVRWGEKAQQEWLKWAQAPVDKLVAVDNAE